MARILQKSTIVLLALVGVATADCWASNKCSRLGLASTVSCNSACDAKGLDASGYEWYRRGLSVWVGKRVIPQCTPAKGEPWNIRPLADNMDAE